MNSVPLKMVKSNNSLLFLPACLVILCATIVFEASSCRLNRIADSNYYVSPSEQTYLEALLLCQLDGMQLISFETESEFLTFNQTMDEWKIDNTIGYWIGGLRIKNGLWYWTSTNKVFNYTNWGTGEPNYSGADIFCLLLGNFRNNGVKEPRGWYAEGCTKNHLYICEKRN